MVQKEVMKKTRNYGLIGILLAIMLVAMIYSYGTTPGTSPLLPSPSVSPTGTPHASPWTSPNPSPLTSPNPTNPSPMPSPTPEPEVSPMTTFSSYEELKDFLNASNQNTNWYYGVTDQSRSILGTMPVPSPVPAPTATAPPMAASAPTAEGTGAKDYSTTNIQVAGVDEADTVKTDGKYLYVIANNSVYIIDANPQSAKVLAKIPFNNTNLSGVYLSQNGNKLAVLGNQYIPYYYLDRKVGAEYSTSMLMPYWNSGTTFVRVYDVTNKVNPVLARNFTMSGSYVNSRMIGDYVYDIITESAYVVNGTATLPTVFSGPTASNIPATKIYYANTTGSYYSYTTIISMNILSDTQQPTNTTIMMGDTGTIYVSQSNIYVTYPQMEWQTITQPTPAPTTSTKPSGTSTGIGILPMPPIMIRPSWQGTVIYRIHVAGASMTFAAKGNVTGNVLNQYAMDESNGYFRIATTSYDYNSASGWGIQQNNVYVLDMTMKVVGKLENLASGENFHSARFMGDRLYMVTFLKTDPLFVIDLSQPTNPKVLGELVIPGYSDYLHPYDATHLIGLGKDTVAADQGNFAWYQGLKLSLFDVSNVNAPKEISKYIIGDRGTSSEALYNPKAFLFDQSKNLLVIPVDLYLINATGTTGQTKPTPTPSGIAPPIPVPTTVPGFTGSSSSQYGMFVWQGVYIFNVSLNGGFVLRGNVTQMDNAAALLANPSLAMISSYQWIDSWHFINRALYIGNTLYTFSETRVQLNSLDNFKLLAKIDLK